MTPLAVTRRARYRRSRNGCLTCKRRKVRCNEERPRCYHCHRLNLECLWRDQRNERAEEQHSANAAQATDFFDFEQSVADGTMDFSAFQDIYLPGFSEFVSPGPPPQERVLFADAVTPGSPADAAVDDPVPMHVPPILEPVENGPKCASVQALFRTLAASSPMVRHSIAAFAAIQLSTVQNKADYQVYYDKAATELSRRAQNASDGLRYVLATTFFLTYIDLLTGRLDFACVNLARAHSTVRASGMRALGPIEQRILSWIRLLDARAALAGGEGLIVNDTSGIYPSTPSSASPSSTAHGTDPAPSSGSHEVIYDMLCQPGLAFYQEVQTITGRITRIAHSHRSRGSVEDETEVMAIAAEILRDLTSLYDRRPVLMDYAVTGDIGEDTLAQPLASAIVRSFQTYLINFYACYLHLHRVAHRHLPRSEAVDSALERIKAMLHLMVRQNESIPVNVLWPLFLWGSEEDDPDECQWILETIRSLHHVASNANMAANVLQEIQRRQREAGERVHISTVCLELFNTTFAIV
ncbi:Zn(II)2Cys6 transcription factor [Aspergillus lucknowensis]|uniref:Fungal-specific transcription factor domain-containing protein n=1 Tax=Aspergillus lucknowensis TaxID=176173 RepID=A0ABR4LIG5_9EURO